MRSTAIEEKTIVFEKLRSAMRIAPVSGRDGLNDEGRKGNIRTIEARVEKFRAWVVGCKNHAQDPVAVKMIAQIDKYWEKLFADPIPVQPPTGLIQPQRTKTYPNGSSEASSTPTAAEPETHPRAACSARS